MATEKQLIGIRLPTDLVTAIRADADAKGQALNVWFTRAAAVVLRRADVEAEHALTLAREFKSRPPDARRGKRRKAL